MLQAARMQALTVLLALLAADGGAVLADALQARGLPARVLQDLVDTPQRSLLQVAPKARAALHVHEAQLGLLLQLLHATLQRADSGSHRLVALGSIAQLARCQAFDLQPEEPRAGKGGSEGAATLRGRLARFNAGVLRVAAAAVAGLPDSEQVLQAAAGFVEAHGRALERMLAEAASAGSRGWVPGAAELEAAGLVLQLLARLVPLHARQPSPVALDLRLRAYQ
jgi:hypothetical protein